MRPPRRYFDFRLKVSLYIIISVRHYVDINAPGVKRYVDFNAPGYVDIKVPGVRRYVDFNAPGVRGYVDMRSTPGTRDVI